MVNGIFQKLRSKINTTTDENIQISGEEDRAIEKEVVRMKKKIANVVLEQTKRSILGWEHVRFEKALEVGENL